MQVMEDENAETEQPNLLQQERQERNEGINNFDVRRIPQEQPMMIADEELRNVIDGSAQPLQQVGPQGELWQRQVDPSASRLLGPSNLSRVMARSEETLRRRPPRDHRTREDESLSMMRRLNINEVERTSVPEQHNNSIPVDDDDSSEAPTPATWSTVPTYGGTPPSERSLHAAAVLNNVLYVFGGYDGVGRVNTFHAYSFQEKRWSPVLAAAQSEPPPSPRDRHVAFSFGNSFYVHGGFDGTSRVSDFWRFDFSSMTWRQVAAVGRSPSPRHSHAAIVHANSFYCFGGYDGSYKSDLHEFNFDTLEWSAVQTTGRRPRARYRATTVVHKDYMILFGGHDGNRHLNDTFIFDLVNKEWSCLVTDGILPSPRDSHVSAIHGNSMYIFGGSSGSALNDLHELQLPTKESSVAKWRTVETCKSNQPGYRFCHVGVVHSDSFFVFGGYDGSNRLRDFIKFDISVHDLSFDVPPSTLISEFRAMVDDDSFSDVTILVEGTPIYAHKLLLMRSPYFRALFLGEMKESTMATVRIEQVSHPIFLQVMEYLYTDQLKIPVESAMELFEAADLFCIPRLKQMCERRILQSISPQNAASIFHAADVHSAIALRGKAKKYILSHFESVSKSPSFENMGRSNIDLVFELLQSR